MKVTLDLGGFLELFPPENNVHLNGIMLFPVFKEPPGQNGIERPYLI